MGGALSQPAPATFFCPAPATYLHGQGGFTAIIIRNEKTKIVPSLSALNACPGLVGGNYMYPKWNLLQMVGDLYVEQYGTTFL